MVRRDRGVESSEPVSPHRSAGPYGEVVLRPRVNPCRHDREAARFQLRRLLRRRN